LKEENQALTIDYRVMMESSPDAVLLLDLDSGFLIHANVKAATLFGTSLPDLLSMTLQDLYPSRQPNGIASPALFGEKIQIAIEGGIVGFTATMCHASTRPIVCEVRMILLPMAPRRLLHLRVIDITQRNRADKLRVGQGRLLEMVARGAPLQDILDSLMLLIEDQSDGVLCSVLLLDLDGRTMRPVSGPSLPPAYMAKLDGLPIGPNVGSCGTAMFIKDIVIVADIDTDPLWAPYKELAQPFGLHACWSTPIYLDKEHVLGSFAMYYREVRSPSQEDLRLISVATHLAGIAIERTRRERELTLHREHLEELVAARTTELTSALETLSLAQEELVRRDKLAALGALVAGVAHELNTPLGNSLVVATTMAEHAAGLETSMEQGLRRSGLERYLALAHEANAILIRNLQRAAGLVSSFKQLAVDQTIATRRSFSLSDLATELALGVRSQLGARPIRLVLDIAPGLNMDSFPGPLAQAIGNVLDNCLVHAFDRDSAGLIRVTVSLRTPGLYAIEVADNGVGMAADVVGRVYDPFFTTKLGSGGSGLGLHVAHNIVTGILGGRFELHSAPGSGSVFTMLLPAEAPGFSGHGMAKRT